MNAAGAQKTYELQLHASLPAVDFRQTHFDWAALLVGAEQEPFQKQQVTTAAMA